MFGIGGGELIFIMFIVLMLFGSDKVPEIARTVGKTMAQIKNATNDIKSEIQKGAEANGFDKQSLAAFNPSTCRSRIAATSSMVSGESLLLTNFNNLDTPLLSLAEYQDHVQRFLFFPHPFYQADQEHNVKWHRVLLRSDVRMQA